MRASLIVAAFNRVDLLEVTLHSIARQKVDGLEVVVVADGDYVLETQKLCLGFGWPCLHGHPDHANWRSGGCAHNIGVKQTTGKVIVLTGGEIYQIDDCLEPMIATVEADPKALATPHGFDGGSPEDNAPRGPCSTPDRLRFALRDLKRLNTNMPFLMAMSRHEFEQIGGYDEDFARGYDFDDRDLMERLLMNKCHYVYTPGSCIHQYHERYAPEVLQLGSNKAIYAERRGVIVRNVGREWGVLC